MRVVLLSWIFLGASFVFALTADEQKQVLELKKKPGDLRSALADASTPPDVTTYFLDIYKSPDKIRAILKNPSEVMAFRKHLIIVLTAWFTVPDEKFRNYRTNESLLAFFAAFADPGESDEIRDMAVYRYGKFILPALAGYEKQTALNSLRQRAREGTAQAWAFPALVLTESRDNVGLKLEELKQISDVNVRRRTMDVLGYHSIARKIVLEPSVHFVIADFLADEDEWVRKRAERALLILPEGVTEASVRAPVNLLSAETLEKLNGLLRNQKPPTRAAAARNLGHHLGTAFFDPRPRPEDRGTYDGLANMLGSNSESDYTAAANAFVSIKPADEEAQLHVAEHAFFGRPDISRALFDALGINDRHSGAHRVRSEKVKGIVLQNMARWFSQRSADTSRLESGAEVIARNPPQSAAVYYKGVYLLSLFPDELSAGEVRAKAKVASILKDVGGFPQEDPKYKMQAAKALVGILDKMTGEGEKQDLETLILHGLSLIAFEEREFLDFIGHVSTRSVRAQRAVAACFASLSKDRATKIWNGQGADVEMYALLKTEDVRAQRSILGAIIKRGLSFEEHSLTLTRIVRLLTSEDEGETNSLSVSELARRILVDLGRTAQRARRVPADDDLINEMIRVANAQSSANASENLAALERLLEKLEKRFGKGIDRNACIAEVIQGYFERKQGRTN